MSSSSHQELIIHHNLGAIDDMGSEQTRPRFVCRCGAIGNHPTNHGRTVATRIAQGAVYPPCWPSIEMRNYPNTPENRLLYAREEQVAHMEGYARLYPNGLRAAQAEYRARLLTQSQAAAIVLHDDDDSDADVSSSSLMDERNDDDDDDDGHEEEENANGAAAAVEQQEGANVENEDDDADDDNYVSSFCAACRDAPFVGSSVRCAGCHKYFHVKCLSSQSSDGKTVCVECDDVAKYFTSDDDDDGEEECGGVLSISFVAPQMHLSRLQQLQSSPLPRRVPSLASSSSSSSMDGGGEEQRFDEHLSPIVVYRDNIRLLSPVVTVEDTHVFFDKAQAASAWPSFLPQKTSGHITPLVFLFGASKAQPSLLPEPFGSVDVSFALVTDYPRDNVTSLAVVDGETVVVQGGMLGQRSWMVLQMSTMCAGGTDEFLIRDGALEMSYTCRAPLAEHLRV